jgi:sugar phosphate isomerase/epimerase
MLLTRVPPGHPDLPVTQPQFSVISDEISQDPAVVVRFARDFGLNGFELRSMFGRAFKDLTGRDVAEIRAIAAGEGLRIHGCATPVFKCEMEDGMSVREHVEILKRSLEAARALECNLVRVFSFLRSPEALSKPVADRIASHLAQLADLAAASGVRLGVENESSCRIGTGAELLRLAESFSHPSAGWIWDPCNTLYVRGENGPPTAAFSRLSDRVIHIHVKDAVPTPGGSSPASPSPVGEGGVGWMRHLAEIRRSGYCGLLSLETHWRKKRLDEKLLHLPAGDAFSAGGDEASRICMRRLLELWQAAASGGRGPDPCRIDRD